MSQRQIRLVLRALLYLFRYVCETEDTLMIPGRIQEREKLEEQLKNELDLMMEKVPG